jgi:CubicO group peptidase (beta-lactamase class C family)
MNINSKFKSLIAVVLLSGFSSLVVANADGNTETKSLAPQATAAQSILSFREIPDLKEAFINAAPNDKKDGILVGELGIDGGNKAMILKLAQEISDNNKGLFDSILIAHKGKLLFESYYSRGRINLPHFQASATKAYTSMAIGRAIGLGYLTMADLDKPLVSFLKDLDPKKFVDGVEKITLHQAMTMRSGIRITKEQRDEFEKNPDAIKGQMEVQAYLEHTAPITLESQSFLYQNDPMFVMQVLDTVVPGTAKDFIKNELLDKLGITNYSWLDDISGLPRGRNGSNMTSRDMLKWGLLAINKGKWKGEQLVPESFIAKATSRIVYTGDDDVYGGGKDVSNQGYGYFWWSADLKHDNKSYFTKSAQGGGGQYIILIEELELMVVVTAHENENSTLQIIAEKILPAFIQNSISTMSKKSYWQNKSPVLEGSYTIAYSSIESGNVEIYQRNTDDNSKMTSTNQKGGYSAWSPDGKRIAFYAKYDDKKTWSIQTMNSDGTNRKRVTHAKNKWDYGPAWSPDEKKIAFAREYKGKDKMSQTEIWMMNSDGSGQTQIKPLSGGAPDFTLDGRLVYNSEYTDKKSEISIADADGNNIIHLTDNEAEEWHPEVSPDGKHIAFMSDRDGNFEIYSMNIDGSNQKRLTNNDVDDWYPSWSPDGSQLIFGSKIDGDRSIYMMNKDGSSVKKIISNGGQAAWFHSQNLAQKATAEEATLPYRDITDLKKAFIDTAPNENEDGILVGELGIDGGNKAMIINFAKEIADN